MADYVHRIGRTGRAGNKGFAYTFLLPNQYDEAKAIIKELKRSNAIFPEEVEKLAGKSSGTKAMQGFSGHGFKFDKSEVESFKKAR